MSVYLDYNATTPINPDVLDEMIDVYKNVPGNPDSRTHDYGDTARARVEKARASVSNILKIDTTEVFFTSGATESNNIVIQGLEEYGVNNGKKHMITSSIEHKAVLSTMKHMEKKGFEVDFVDPGSDGVVSSSEILDRVREDTLLVSVMHVNNETGMIQPIREIGAGLDKRDVFFHIDATQSFGKLVEQLQECRYDMLSFSAHKFSGPQGIGGLVLRRKNYKLPPVSPIMYGGQQEHGISPGTIPVALIAGLGKACDIAYEGFEEHKNRCEEIQKAIIELLDASGLVYRINGNLDQCIYSTLNVMLKGVSSEALMISSKQYCGISNGSACTSNSYEPSYVLRAMGMKDDDILSSIRISWGSDSSKDEVIESISKLIDVAKSLV